MLQFAKGLTQRLSVEMDGPVNGVQYGLVALSVGLAITVAVTLLGKIFAF